MKEGTVQFRKAEKHDAAGIEALYGLLLGEQSDIRQAEDMLDSLQADDSNLILVAETEGKIVGTLQVGLIKSIAFGCRSFAVLDFFIVDPSCRRQGIGTKLFEYAESLCKERDVSCIILVSGKERKEAHEFYREMGYDVSVKGFRKDFA